MELQTLVRQDEHFSWLPTEAFDILDACFDLRGETVSAGESRETAGRIGYLLRGTGTINGENARAGTLFGIRREREMAPAVLTAETDCEVLWLRFEVMGGACYLACWFHARLMEELDKLTV